MKKTSLLFIGMLTMAAGFSQENGTVYEGESIMLRPVAFEITKPLREIAAMNPVPDSYEEPNQVESKDGHKKRQIPPAVNPNAQPQGDDPIWQREHGTRQGRAPIAAWNGLSGSGFPPDPSGAAGPSHYFQAVNTSYRIYSKTGTGMSSQTNLSTLWTGSTNDGDPIVLYDKYADRWFISQFQISGNKILIAISTTNDPMGTYYAYQFVPVSGSFPDYPKYSIWHDGYYLACNYGGGTKRFIVFERAKMLAGDSSAGMIVKTLTGVPSNNFFCMLPADADGTLPPSGTPCYFFSYEDDAWASGTVDQLRVYKMTTNWTTATATIALDMTLPTQAFNASFSNSWTDIAQPGTTQKIDAIGGVLNFRAQYRRWTGYNTVVLCHAVKVNTTTGQAGVRWYELRQDATSGVWSIYQQGTYAPDTDSRWLGSIAMDDNGNIGMAYAVSSSTTFPSIRYTGRFATDPLGVMTTFEQTAAVGTSSQTSTERYGDYSHTSLDPDGITFWHTGEYYGGGKRTRIFSFQISGTQDVEENTVQPEFNVFQNGTTLNVNGKNIPNETMQVDLFDASGKLISESKSTPNAGVIQTTIDVTGLATGTYLVRVGNAGFQRVVKVSVNN
jgi:hypothetical protein